MCTLPQLYTCKISNAPINPDSDDSNKKEFAKIGAIVDIKWTVSEVHGTDWKAGWYRAKVQGYYEDTDIVTSEPHETYEEELHQKIKLLKLPI